jgi:hypothetical protein
MWYFKTSCLTVVARRRYKKDQFFLMDKTVYVVHTVLHFAPNTRSKWGCGTYNPRVIQIHGDIHVGLIKAVFTLH